MVGELVSAAMSVQAIIAYTLYCEAGGEVFSGRVAVAEVIMNRARHHGLLLEQVCLQPFQFSCWNDGEKAVIAKVRARLHTGDPAEVAALIECWKLAGAMIRGEFEPIAPWTHYYAMGIERPMWSYGATSMATIGNQVFLAHVGGL